MEWQDISLNNWRQRRWCRDVRRSLKSVICGLILIFVILYGLINQIAERQQENNRVQNQLNSARQTVEQLNKTITLLSKNQFDHQIGLLSPEKIHSGLSLIENIPIAGWIDSIQIYIEQIFILKIAGKLSQTQFEQLEKQLKSNPNIVYQLEHFQINDKKQLDIILIIRFIENEQQTSTNLS